MCAQNVAGYIKQNDLGYALIIGNDISKATVEDITTDKSAMHLASYEPNLLISHCQNPETQALLIITMGNSGKVSENEYSAAYVAANIAAKAGRKGMAIINVNKKEGTVEKKFIVPEGHICKCFDRSECSLEEFLKYCNPNA
jgi:hypothetical protein